MFIERLLDSEAKIKLLRSLSEFGHAYSLYELAKTTGLSIGAVHKVISIFTKENLVQEIKGKGKQKYYRFEYNTGINQYANPILAMFDLERKELRVVPLEVRNVLESLCSSLLKKIPGILSCVLYGSVVKGLFEKDSTVEVLCIVEEKFPTEKAKKIIVDKFNKKVAFKIQVQFLTKKQFQQHDQFDEIVKEGKILINNEKA